MALQDKLGTTLPSHQFSDAVRLWAEGNITRQNVIDALSLDASDEAQLDELKAVYEATSPALAKLAYLSKLESVLRLLEVDMITLAQAKSFLGLA